MTSSFLPRLPLSCRDLLFPVLMWSTQVRARRDVRGEAELHISAHPTAASLCPRELHCGVPRLSPPEWDFNTRTGVSYYVQELLPPWCFVLSLSCLSLHPPLLPSFIYLMAHLHLQSNLFSLFYPTVDYWHSACHRPTPVPHHPPRLLHSPSRGSDGSAALRVSVQST